MVIQIKGIKGYIFNLQSYHQPHKHHTFKKTKNFSGASIFTNNQKRAILRGLAQMGPIFFQKNPK